MWVGGRGDRSPRAVMSGMELGSVAAIALSAASSLGFAGNPHVGSTSSCLHVSFKQKARHHRKIHHLDPPHHQQLMDSPMEAEKVKVLLSTKIDAMTHHHHCGKKQVLFNGEVLSIADDRGTFKPTLALGGCQVKGSKARVHITP